MIYAINRKTKEHRIAKPATTWSGYDWELVEADADGWIEWNKADQCPLPDDHIYEAKYAEGFTHTLEKPQHNLAWLRLPTTWHLVAYRPILEPQAEQVKEWDGEGVPDNGELVRLDIMGLARDAFTFVGMHNGRAVVFGGPMKKYHDVALGVLTPCRTDRERWIEAAMKIYHANKSVSVPDAMGDIYDAGLARLRD